MKNINNRSLTALMFVFSLSTNNVFAEVEPVKQQIQEHIGTITNYYQTVREKAFGEIPKNNEEKRQERHRDIARDPFASSVRSAQQSPIRAGANYRASAYTLAGRDPFAVTPIMLENENFTLKQEIEFTPLTGDFKIPKMYLKGIITGREDDNNPRKMAALLEIDGLGVFVVHEGDTVGLHGIGNGRDVIKIESISRLSLVVQSGTYGGTAQKRIVVR